MSSYGSYFCNIYLWLRLVQDDYAWVLAEDNHPSQGRRMDPVEVLSFFFMLSTMELGWVSQSPRRVAKIYHVEQWL